MLLQPWQNFFDEFSAIAGADPADIDQMIAAVDADEKGAEFAVGFRVGANHHLMTCPAFGFGPFLCATGLIGRIVLFRNDAFERQLAGRPQYSITAGLEMLDETEPRIVAAVRQELLQPVLARNQSI